MAAIDNTFERIDLSLQRLEDEMRAMRSDLGNEMRAMRGDLSALQRQLTRIFAGFAVGLLAVVAASLVANF